MTQWPLSAMTAMTQHVLTSSKGPPYPLALGNPDLSLPMQWKLMARQGRLNCYKGSALLRNPSEYSDTCVDDKLAEFRNITTIVGKQKQPLDYDFLIHRILEYVSICFLMFPFLSFKIFKLVQPLQCSTILLMMLLMMIKDVQCISMSMNSPNSPGCAGSCAGQWGPKAWEVHGCRGWLQRIDVWDGAEVACNDGNDGNDGNDYLGRPWDAMTPWHHDAMTPCLKDIERHIKTAAVLSINSIA